MRLKALLYFQTVSLTRLHVAWSRMLLRSTPNCRSSCRGTRNPSCSSWFLSFAVCIITCVIAMVSSLRLWGVAREEFRVEMLCEGLDVDWSPIFVS